MNNDTYICGLCKKEFIPKETYGTYGTLKTKTIYCEDCILTNMHPDEKYKGRLIPEARFQNEPVEEHHLRDLIEDNEMRM
jgi:hypothetical protein